MEKDGEAPEFWPCCVSTDTIANGNGESLRTRERVIEGFELPQAGAIADAFDCEIAAPVAANIGHVEITPTLDVPGGLQTERPEECPGGRGLEPVVREGGEAGGAWRKLRHRLRV